MDKVKRATQADRILAAFKMNGNILTPSDIMRMGIAQYNARIFELKEKGYVIKNEPIGTSPSGERLTRFVLISGPDDWNRPKPQSSAHEAARKIAIANNQEKNLQPSLL